MRRKFTLILLSLSATAMIMAQETVFGDIDRSNWTVTTQTDTNYGYAVDNSTGLPEHMFDGDAGSYLSLAKPGKDYGGSGTQGTNFLPSFTIDLQSEKTFDYIKWNHRSGSYAGVNGNSKNYLRVFGIDVFGSNTGDASDFIQINTDGIVWIPNVGGYNSDTGIDDPNTYVIEIPESTCRFIKVQLVIYSNIYAGQHPDYPGAGPNSGSTMQIAEFGLGKSGGSSVEKISLSGVSVYPNSIKAGQAFTISLGSEISDAVVSVYTISGIKLSEQEISGNSATQTIDNQGMYIVEVTKNAGKYITKVVVK